MSIIRPAVTKSPVIALMALALAGIASGSVVYNYSFETPVQSPDGFTYNPTDPNWTFDGNSGVAAEGSPFFTVAPPDGDQAAFLQVYGGGPASGDSISQTITLLTVGNAYQFTLWAALRPGFAVNDFDVTFGGTTIADVVPTSTNFVEFTTSAILATSTSEVLSFQSLDTAGSFDADSIIDDIGISNVSGAPEPATLAMLGSGLIGMYWLRRRAKRS